MRDEAVPEPGGVGLDAVVLQHPEQFVAVVIGVFNDPVGLLPTLLSVEVLHGWQPPPGDVPCSFHHPL